MKGFKKYFWIISILLFSSADSVAQTEIDSLKSLLNQKLEDTTRINILCTLSWKLRHENANNADELALEAIEIAEKIGNQKQTIRAIHVRGTIAQLAGNYDRAIELEQQAIRLAKEIGDEMQLANAMNGLGLTYKALGEIDKAIEQLKGAQIYAQREKAENFVTTIQNNIGHTFFALSQYDSARTYYFDAVSTALQRKDSENIQRSYNSIGVCYIEEGNFTAAFDYYYKSLIINEKLNNHHALGIGWNNLGNLFHAIKDYEKAIFYHEKALARRTETGNKKQLANSNNNIGMCYLDLGNYDKAAQYFRKALEIYEIIDTKANLGGLLNNMGLVFENQGLHEKAEKHYQRSLEAYEQTGNLRGKATTLAHLAGSSFFQKKYEKGLSFAKEGLKIAKEINVLVVEKNCYHWLANNFDALNQPENAAANYKSYIEISETLKSENRAKEIAQSIAKYELDKKEEIIEAQNQEITNLENKKKAEKNKGNLFLGLIVLLILLILISTYQFREKQKMLKRRNEANLDLAKMNAKVMGLELEKKERELKNYVQLIHEKNEVLELLKEKLNGIQQNQHQISVEDYQALNQSISEKLNNEKSWEQFQQQFSQIHGDFLTNFATKYPNLTAHDLRIITLLRLNMSNKEISKLLNIEPDSVKRARNRLRKKLNLEPKEDLATFIIKFSA